MFLCNGYSIRKFIEEQQNSQQNKIISIEIFQSVLWFYTSV